MFQDVPSTSHFGWREGGKAREGLVLSFKDMIWKLTYTILFFMAFGQNLVIWPFLAIKEGNACFILGSYVFSYNIYIYIYTL